MKCRRMEKWISDALDGELSPRREVILERHLRACPACRSYREGLDRIRAETGRWISPEIPEPTAREFSGILRREMESESGAVRRPPAWRWVAVSASALILVGAWLFTRRNGYESVPQTYSFVLSYDEALTHVYEEIGADRELEEMFDTLILASLDISLEDEAGMGPAPWRHSIWGEVITDEEWAVISSELKKDLNS